MCLGRLLADVVVVVTVVISTEGTSEGVLGSSGGGDAEVARDLRALHAVDAFSGGGIREHGEGNRVRVHL